MNEENFQFAYIQYVVICCLKLQAQCIDVVSTEDIAVLIAAASNEWNKEKLLAIYIQTNKY